VECSGSHSSGTDLVIPLNSVKSVAVSAIKQDVSGPQKSTEALTAAEDIK